jgi:hypothetical protein
VFSSPGRVPEGQEPTALIAGTKVGRRSGGFRHSGTTSTEAYDVDASLMR